ncbi:MAG: class I SAM-dependent methyltransferase [Chloroflexota bacterium]
MAVEETSEHWDKHVERVEAHTLKGWLDWEYLEREYFRPQISGDPDVYYLHHFINQHLPNSPVPRALSLGCGGGNLERALIQLGAAQMIDAYDVSKESIRLAKQMAEEVGLQDRIHYEVRNINKIELPPKTYDFVIIKMALHHFEQLEHVYAQIAQSLTDDGVLVFNEFIGASRFQWTDQQLGLMNELIRVLPDKHRWSVWAQQELGGIERPTLAHMIAMDTSEAVRSAEIMPRLKDHFEIVEYKPYGGTLMHMLLTHIMGTFDLENPEEEALLKLLLLHEKTLIQHGVIGSDFAYVVAQPIGSKPRARIGEPPPIQEATRLRVPLNQMVIGRLHWVLHRVKAWLKQLQ